MSFIVDDFVVAGVVVVFAASGASAAGVLR
jgi:hypothetical protein